MSDLSSPSCLPVSDRQADSLADSVREQWISELKEHGCSLTRGTSIDEYAAAFTDVNNAPKSMKALQKRVKGDFDRVRIAFTLLSKAIKPTPIIREKSVWFVDVEQRLSTALKEQMSIVWQTFDSEVQCLVTAQTQVSLNRITELDKENAELAQYINELQKQEENTEELQKSVAEIESKLAHAEQVCSGYEQRNNELREQLHELLTIKRDFDVASAKNGFLQQQVEDLKVDKQRLLEMLSHNSVVDHSELDELEVSNHDDQVIIPEPSLIEN
jgi:chromosome segregation ATPase